MDYNKERRRWEDERLAEAPLLIDEEEEEEVEEEVLFEEGVGAHDFGCPGSSAGGVVSRSWQDPTQPTTSSPSGVTFGAFGRAQDTERNTGRTSMRNALPSTFFDQAEAEAIARQEDEELEALVSLLPGSSRSIDTWQASPPQLEQNHEMDQCDDDAASHFGSDDEVYEDIFAGFDGMSPRSVLRQHARISHSNTQNQSGDMDVDGDMDMSMG